MLNIIRIKKALEICEELGLTETLRISAGLSGENVTVQLSELEDLKSNDIFKYAVTDLEFDDDYIKHSVIFEGVEFIALERKVK